MEDTENKQLVHFDQEPVMLTEDVTGTFRSTWTSTSTLVQSLAVVGVASTLTIVLYKIFVYKTYEYQTIEEPEI